MKSLLETNPHLKDLARVRRRLTRNVLDSSIFEGATSLRGKLAAYSASSKPRRKARTRKAVKGS